MNNTTTNKISANRQKKEQIVAEISEKIAKAKTMVFTNYQGLSHKQIENFKREIKKSDAEFAVTKNTLLRKALSDTNQKIDDEKNFDLPTGTVFLYGDITIPLKTLAKMIKDFEKPKIKFGLMEGKVISEQDILKLASLPSREILLAQLANMMLYPIQELHRSLVWNLQKFVMTLKAIEKIK
jgi:large subunit ribosomal protein L10